MYKLSDAIVGGRGEPMTVTRRLGGCGEPMTVARRLGENIL